MVQKRVLLLNPSNDSNEKIIKDQYCSFTSKADYFWVPIDLLTLSGDLAQEFDVKVIDATAQKLDRNSLVSQVNAYAPDFIVILSSLLTHQYDRKLIREFRLTNPKLVTTFLGDIFYFNYKEMIKYPEVDSIIYDYPCPELATYFKHGHVDAGIIYKDENNEIVETPKHNTQSIYYTMPKHELFDLKNYSVPFMFDDVCTSVLTNFGCKFTCNYCPASSVSYRQRQKEDILDELTHLRGLGIKNIWIRDFTFGLKADLTKSLLRDMKTYDFNWFCLTRAEVLDDELIELMSQAGCYLAMVGVDSIGASTMKTISRVQRKDIISKRISKAKDCHIQVLVHMILGLPNESIRDMLKTIHFLSSTKANFLSINFFSPRAGSKYFSSEFIEEHDAKTLDSCYADFEKGTRMGIIVLKYYALLMFYCNPVRVLRILISLKSKKQFKLIMQTGLKQFFPKLNL